MKPSSVFWSLVRHEMAMKGNRRKGSQVARKWWMVYFVVLATAGLVAALYFALHNELNLPYIWYATLGIPYIAMMFGVNSIKREWDNETQGWWLTLPYRRSLLVAAKWVSSTLLTLAALAAVYIVGTVLATGIALGISGYSLANVGGFMIIGLNWLLPLAGFCPLLLALGMLIAASQYTKARPISPLLWFLFMGGCSLFYQNFNGFGIKGIVDQVSSGSMELLPYPWEMGALIVAGWLVTGLVLGLIAYLFDKKLSF
ncbi:ABC transporter permease subunit [Paenibacillus athensensis]|uniref:Uncharacterized protein n=1 Tax=Paenibacillus athensensis TaxID=1967502 RepID=A0A4Y8PW68_9BACL|nr:ABC transporter permease subunit [Paenibacillus athensensis]MCD1260575.1 ABC transporter permease subunit [Paenibacillus athensensis]